MIGPVSIIGAGMTAWGKWGRSFTEYAVTAAQLALDDAGVAWPDVQLIVAGETVRNGYAGYVAGAAIAQGLGFNGASVTSVYGACASGTMAINHARLAILAGSCDVAVVVGGDTTPKGFLAPNPGERPDDPDWLRFRLLGATNPAYFGLYARRRMDLYGATPADFALVKVKNSRNGSQNPRARFRSVVSVEEVLASPVVADPLHLLDVCATSDGAAALVLASPAYAAKQAASRRSVHLRAAATVTPSYPNVVLELPNFATDAAPRPPERTYRQSIGDAAFREAGIGPQEVDVAEVYDLSTALELDWYEDLGFCGPGEAEALVRSGATDIGGTAVTVNASGGLASFGEAVPAQAIAQVCELVWQLRGEADHRQVAGARVGLAANQGLFGHGSAVIVTT